MVWRKGTLFLEDQVYFSAAVLAVEAVYGKQGIRQRDLKFFFELFRSWSAEFFHNEIKRPRNMQVARALRQLVSAGFAKVSRRGGVPHYQLTSAGLIDTTRSLVASVTSTKIEQSIFVFYFLRQYRAKILQIVQGSLSKYSAASVSEIERLLDLEELRRELLADLDHRISLFTNQIGDSARASREALALHSKGARPDEITRMLQRDFPYHLNAQRPLKELYPQLPTDISLWEITEGPGTRANLLWNPLLTVLKTYRKLLADY